MQNWTAEEAQHNLAAKALTDAVKKCDKNGVSPEVTVQTLKFQSQSLCFFHAPRRMTPRACLSAWLHQSAVVKLLDRRAPRAASRGQKEMNRPNKPSKLTKTL
jgi:hypothetical protein